MRRCVHHACRPKFKWQMAYRRFVYQWVHMWIYEQNYMVKCLSDPKIIGGYFLDVKDNG